MEEHASELRIALLLCDEEWSTAAARLGAEDEAFLRKMGTFSFS